MSNITATLTIYNSKADRAGNCYWAFRYEDLASGKEILGQVGALVSDGNLRQIAFHLNGKSWEPRNIKIDTYELKIREFNHMVKTWPERSSNPETLADDIRHETGPIKLDAILEASRADRLKIVNDAFVALRDALDGVRHWSQYIKQLEAEERDERRLKANGLSTGRDRLTKTQAVKVHALRQIIKFLTRNCKPPDHTDIFFYQISAFMAAAVVDEERERITKALESFDLRLVFAAADYAKLN